MKFLTFEFKDELNIGVLKDDNSIIPLNEPLTGIVKKLPDTMLEFIRAAKADQLKTIKEKISTGSFKAIPLDNVKILAPIPYPQRDIFCLGKNYKKHAEEIAESIATSEKIPTQPIYFSKSAYPAIGYGECILAHEHVTAQIDYEVELAVVIGKDGKNISTEKAEDYIFGYTIINDVSARDLQTSHSQWFRGKSLDTFCPMGPYIVEKSGIPFPIELDISCIVNGEVRQASNTRNMIFDIPFVISQLSQGIELRAGDIIAWEHQRV